MARRKSEPPKLEPEESKPKIRYESASKFKEKKVNWLWHNRISFGGITFFDGDPGLGKSTLAYELAAAVSQGRSLPDSKKLAKGDVVMMIAEDDPSTTSVARLKAAKANLNRVWFFGRSSTDGNLDLPHFPFCCPELLELIQGTGSKFLVVDPYLSFLAPGLNPFVEQDVRSALGPLNALAQQTGIAVLCIRHPNKNSSQKKIYRGGGSLGVTAIARTVLWLGQDPDDEDIRIVSGIKNNLGPIPKSVGYRLNVIGHSVAVDWSGLVEDSGDDEVSESEILGKKDALGDAKRFLESELKEGPVPTKEIQIRAQAAGISVGTLRNAKAALGVWARRRTENYEPFWEWGMPKN